MSFVGHINLCPLDESSLLLQVADRHCSPHHSQLITADNLRWISPTGITVLVSPVCVPAFTTVFPFSEHLSIGLHNFIHDHLEFWSKPQPGLAVLLCVHFSVTTPPNLGHHDLTSPDQLFAPLRAPPAGLALDLPLYTCWQQLKGYFSVFSSDFICACKLC